MAKKTAKTPYSYSIAAKAFRETLERLDLPDTDPLLEDPAALGERAALSAAADAIWRKKLGPYLTSKEVQELIGVGTRQAVSDLAKRRRLLALTTKNGRVVYPAFQFSPSGRPYPVLPRVLGLLEKAAVDPYTIASWLTTPQTLLENETPARWLRSGRDPKLVVEAARRKAGQVGH